MNDNYVTNAIFSGVGSVLGGIILFFGSACFGQLLFVITGAVLDGSLQRLSGEVIHNLMSAGLVLFFSTGGVALLGPMTGIGTVPLLIDLWYIYRVAYQDESAITFFLVIAANQVLLCVSASILNGTLYEGWLAGVLSLLWLGLSFWAAKWWQRRQRLAVGISD